MKHFVARTCTVVSERNRKPSQETESSLSHEAESRSLESFRDAPAYVLLGPPGCGKTEAFKREASRDGVGAVTARDFWTLSTKPELHDQTIYIDGLDEIRAGSTDGRTPFDGIRAKLQALGCPQFRLSCREADWFGANDREKLKAVSPNGEVLVVRLDPLSDQGVLEILERNDSVHDPAAFVEDARRQGVRDLLRNPQNLRMLAEAVAEADGAWPRTRTETFELACQRLVSEENPEHQIAWRGTVDTKTLLDVAGDLCVLLLLSGNAGVTLPGTEPDSHHPRLDQVTREDQQFLRRVLGTSLFESSSEGRLVPAHRQVAEFLGARRLADLIAEGLPVQRALALLTGFDGGIVSEFRGLAAWLAAQSTEARAESIERDPLGAVLYGDVQQFGPHEKRLLFQALKGEIDQNPWLVSYTGSDSPLRSLVGPDLENDMRQALTNPARDEAHQSFVLLIDEAIRDAAHFPELADPLMAIVRDDSWRPTIRCAALEAYMRARQDDPQVSLTLRELLDDVYTGVVATQDDDLLGTLLTELYPDDLPVLDLVGCLREPAQRNLWTRYGVFWTVRLIEKSTIEQMVQLLDLLKVPMEQLRAESGESPRHADLVTRPPVVLLRHLLERSPESVSQEQLFYWLDFAAWLGRELRFSAPGMVTDAEFFGNWLSDRPDIQKAIIEDGVNRCRKERQSFGCMRHAKRSLFRATPPEDYGTWCADQALGASNDEIALWFVWEAAEFVHNAKGSEAQQTESIARKLRGDARLAEVFEGRLTVVEKWSDFQEGLQHIPQARSTPNDGRFDKLRGLVKTHTSALHANQCPPNLLHHLARAYLNDFSDVPGQAPEDRLRFLLGPGDGLYAAALAGLRGAIGREDLPTDTEILKLTVQGQLHLLAYPFMVGLEELHKRTGTNGFHLDEAQKRLALATHFMVWRLPHVADAAHPPRWLQVLLTQDPEVVSEVWARCARARLLNGEELLPDAHELVHKPDFVPLAKAAAIPLLQSFPVRCKAGQLPILRSLLQAACLYGDRTRFLELIEAKLAFTSMSSGQRVYWLTAGLFVAPDAYGDRLELFVSERDRRVQRVAEMAVDGHAVPQPLRDMWNAIVVERLVRLIGPHSAEPPNAGEAHWIPWPIQAYRGIHALIDRLAEDTSAAAMSALECLASDNRLANWRSQLLDRVHRQKSVRREANFVHPSFEQVSEVLDNGRPANAADLAAAILGILRHIARDIRDGANSSWQQCWNVDQYDRPTHPKPENACRRALLDLLRPRLDSLGIDTQPGGRYADNKRSDIRVAYSGCNVPIEIKRGCHRELWSAMRTQLIAKYTRDPGTDGYGIYLVFWFGEAEQCRPTPRSGPKPQSPEELRQALIGTLSAHERRKISVCVIDVSKPDA